MTGWYAKRARKMSGRAVIALTLLALLLLAVMPVALVVAVIMMILGHVLAGFALFGGVLLAVGLTIALAGITGKRHVRSLLSAGNLLGAWPGWPGSGQQAGPSDAADPEDPAHVVRLDRSEYTDMR